MDPRRRLFLRGSLRPGTAELAPTRPPWAVEGEREFQARCTRCDACITACPQNIVTRGDGGYPTMDFSAHGCDLCGRCLAICRTGALRDTGKAPRPWRVQVGQNCLTRQRVECQSCADTCEPRALRFALAPGGIAQLQVNPASCNGCGDCVSICPVGAISMVTATTSGPARDPAHQ